MNLANHERQLCATALRLASCSEPNEATKAEMERVADKMQVSIGSQFRISNDVNFALSRAVGITYDRARELAMRLPADDFIQLVLALHAGNCAAVDAIIGAAAFM